MNFSNNLLQDESEINRFTASVEQLLHNNNQGNSYTMVVFDISNLSDIATYYGASVESDLIHHTQKVLNTYIHGANIYCHFYSGRFALFLENYKNIDLALLIISLTEEITGFNMEYGIRLSFGVCKADSAATSISSLYCRALYANASVNMKSFGFLADYSEIEHSCA